MLDRPEPSGLVCGYRIRAAGRLEPLEWAEMDEAVADPDSIAWLHFNLADERARAWLRDTPSIPAAAKPTLLGDDRHLKLDVCGEALVGVVCDLHHEFAERASDFEVLRIYLDRRCLISARQTPLAGIDKLRQSIDQGLSIERPAGIVAHFLHHVTDAVGDLLIKLSDDIDEMEEALLLGRNAPMSAELARIRRITVRLRRHMVPQQHALIGLVSGMPAWITGEEAQLLRRAIERFGAFGHDLDLVQERARLLADQLGARLMEASNRNLYILSIITAVFMPMSLITGFFGMSVGGLPWQQDPHGFWYATILMVALCIVTFVVMRGRRML